MGSIEWYNIPKNARVVDHGTHYTANGRLVTWGSEDSFQAQRKLTELALNSKKKK